MELQRQREAVETIANKIENDEAYMEDLKQYLPMLNQTVMTLFEMVQDPAVHMAISQEFVLQVLGDIIDGIEREDSVCLEDVLRYGLIEIYDYVGVELQEEDHHEQAGI